MNINFSKLQDAFKEYLLQNGDITQEEYDSESNSISIFNHMSEFSNYIKSEYSDSDDSIFSMKVSDILKLEIENGQIVDKTAQNSSEDENGQTSFNATLNEILKEDAVKNIFDMDKDGQLSNEEIMAFLYSIKNLDGNARRHIS